MNIGIKSKFILIISVIGIVLALVFPSCRQKEYISLSGKTMGTYYSIQYSSDENYEAQIDSLLKDFISAASTYDSLSELSAFNRTGTLHFKTPHLYRMLTIAKTFHQRTHGAFEPTLMPVISAHGFNNTNPHSTSKQIIDSLLSFVSFDYIAFDSTKMTALKKGVQLDLSAMGEGFAIDLIAEFLEKHNVLNYKVEIGGEMKCKGRNPKNELWLIGIESPESNHHHILNTVRLQNEAISTSGNYRNFYKDTSGKRRSHIIDPKTGDTVQHNLISVTIKSKSAVTADAIATACMVMGYDTAIAFIEQSDMEAFITYEENGKIRVWHSRDFFPVHYDRSLMLR